MSSTAQHLQKATNKTHTLSSTHITISNFHHIHLLPSIISAIVFCSALYTEPYFGGHSFYWVLFNLGKVNLWFQHDNLKLFLGVYLLCDLLFCLSDVYWTMHHFDNWNIKNQLDVTYYNIIFLIGSTCFRHYCVHHYQWDNQHYSRELLMTGIEVPETRLVYKKYNKIIRGI